MSQMKIAGKIHEAMKSIPIGYTHENINECLIAQKLITQTEFKIVESKERTSRNGVVWQVVIVSCQLTIIDTESDETIINVALGAGTDTGDKAVAKAQMMAREYVWMAALNTTIEGVPFLEAVSEPEIIVETPTSKLMAEVTALWRWDPALFQDYFMKRFQRPIDQLNITELSVVKSEFENYGR